MDPIVSPALLQYGALGLAAIVIFYAARFVADTRHDTAKREERFFQLLEEQRREFSTMLEKHDEKYAEKLGEVTAALHLVSDRLEVLEVRGHSSKRNMNDT